MGYQAIAIAIPLATAEAVRIAVPHLMFVIACIAAYIMT
jgi:hypothetical protein